MVFWAALPIAVLLILLVYLRFTPLKAGAISFAVSLIIALAVFRAGLSGILVTLGKGLALSVNIVLIIWAAVYLYNFVDETGAMGRIKSKVSGLIEDRFLQFLMLAWLFTPLLQGIAGFGVPVAIVTGILVSMGFDPLGSVTASLVGHSWSVSFGSMGTSYYTISLVTGLSYAELGPWFVFFTGFAMFLTGISISFIYGGKAYIRRAMPSIAIGTAVMTGALYMTVAFGIFSISLIASSIAGIAAFLALSGRRGDASHHLSGNGGPDESMSFMLAVSPYLLVMAMTVILYFMPFKELGAGFSFPGYETGLGYVVEPARSYAKFRPFSHPAPIILAASLASITLYSRKGFWKKGAMSRIATKTARKCLNTTYTLLCFIPMAIVMMDAGMMKELSAAVAALTGKLFPVVSPMIGALGSFITGSNTTSNVIFGKFQQMVAERLGITAAMICAAQSVGASIGCALGPTQVLLGITAAGLDNQAHRVYKKVLPLVVITVLLMGLPTLAFALLGKGL